MTINHDWEDLQIDLDMDTGIRPIHELIQSLGMQLMPGMLSYSINENNDRILVKISLPDGLTTQQEQTLMLWKLANS